MNIIVGEVAAKNISDKYIVLELDTFRSSRSSATDSTVKTFCVIEKLDLGEFFSLTHYQDLHHNLIKNYRKKNWRYCIDAINHLRGKWNGELDSFYENIESRVKTYQVDAPEPGWDGTIVRQPSDDTKSN